MTDTYKIPADTLEPFECIECNYMFLLDEIVVEATINCPNCGEAKAEPTESREY